MKRIRICFFLSGFCSLLYQTVWLRLAIAHFGVNAPVIASVLAVFMLGLAFGNFAAGRFGAWIEKQPASSGLKPYAWLEIMISAGGWAVPGLLWLGSRFITPLSSSGQFFFLASFAVIVGALLPFCAAMGATVPVMLALMKRDRGLADKEGFSQLYLYNVMGAIYGTFASAFVLIELWGFRKTLLLAVAVNWLIAVLAWTYRSTASVLASVESTCQTRSRAPLSKIDCVTLAIFGFGSMGLEVIWSRMYVFFTGAVVYAFALILITYLLATLVGTLVYRRLGQEGVRDWIYRLMVWAGPVSLIVLVTASPGSGLPVPLAIFLGVAPLSFLLGIITPALIDSMTDADPEQVSRAYTYNLMGCVFGPLVTGFIMIPKFGSQGACIGLAALMTVPFAIWTVQRWRSLNLKSAWLRWIAAAMAAFSLLGWTRPFETAFGPGAKVFYDNTATSVAYGQDMDKMLIVEGTSMTSLSVVTKLIAHLPLASAARRPQKIALICFGMGTTFRSALTWGGDVTVVELVPSVPKLFPYFFDNANEVLSNPRGHVVIDDGRRFMTRTTDVYDSVIVDPPPPVESVSSGLLYSTEFYEVIKKKLKKGGIVGTIMPASDAQSNYSVWRALKEVFPYVRVFEPYGKNNIFQFMASEYPITPKSARQLADATPEEAKADLIEWRNRIALWSPETPEENYQKVLDHEVPENVFLERFVPAKAIPLTDDRPVNEYYCLRRNLDCFKR